MRHLEFVELQSFLVKNRQPNKYHPYSRKYPGTDVMGTCPICKKDVLRKDGFVVEEQMFPTIEKTYFHHSPMDKCLEIHFNNKRIEEENQRKSDLGFPKNPLDHLLKLKK